MHNICSDFAAFHANIMIRKSIISNNYQERLEKKHAKTPSHNVKPVAPEWQKKEMEDTSHL